VVSAVCPRCKGPISFETTADAPQYTPPDPASPPSAEEHGGYQERGQPRALVCVNVPEEREQVITILKRIGCAPHSTKDSGEAIGRLRLSDYAIVVLSGGFDPPGQDGPSIRAYLDGMGMTRRRNIHLVLIDPGLPSSDERGAFARSVDLVLRPSDLSHFEEALGHSKAEKENRYRVLKESLRAMGKA